MSSHTGTHVAGEGMAVCSVSITEDQQRAADKLKEEMCCMRMEMKEIYNEIQTEGLELQQEWTGSPLTLNRVLWWPLGEYRSRGQHQDAGLTPCHRSAQGKAWVVEPICWQGTEKWHQEDEHQLNGLT